MLFNHYKISACKNLVDQHTMDLFDFFAPSTEVMVFNSLSNCITAVLIAAHQGYKLDPVTFNSEIDVLEHIYGTDLTLFDRELMSHMRYYNLVHQNRNVGWKNDRCLVKEDINFKIYHTALYGFLLTIYNRKGEIEYTKKIANLCRYRLICI